MSAPTNSLDFVCDWRFGFNLDSNSKGTVGYLLMWSGCGGLNLAKDITVWNPFDAAGQTVVTGPTIQCIGLIESFRYAGGGDDPIRISVYVSKGTAADVRGKLASPVPNTKLQLTWYIVSYDDEKKGWYEAALVRDTGKVDASVDTANGDLQMFVANDGTRISDTLDLKVYKFEFQVVPAANKTSLLEFATGPSQKLVKQWGDEDSD
jgi:hypothetical protein